MPNHWESSARPLFVKTVFVDGNRHAILSPEDPLLHTFSKKHSRPNSSLSIASVMSFSSSDSANADSSVRDKAENFRRLRKKDISSQLQDCLIKLRVASRMHKCKSKNKNGEVVYDVQDEENWPQNPMKENSKETNRKINRAKSGRNNDTHFEGDFAEKNKLTDVNSSGDHCCYVYNFENNRGKKNYCFVKITSKPSQVSLDCSCEKSWGENHNSCVSKEVSSVEKNNVLVSATFHNFIMSSLGSNNSADSSHSTKESDFCDFYWNNYLTKSYYNSLSERVIQWLDLASKRKKCEQLIHSSNILSGNAESLFVERAFLGGNNKSANCEKLKYKTENTEVMKKDKANSKISEKDFEDEVKNESNVETALSLEDIKIDQQNQSEDIKMLWKKCFSSENSALELDLGSEDNKEGSPMISIPTKIDPNFILSAHLQKSISDQLSSSCLNSSNLGARVQKLILNDSSEASSQTLDVNYKRKIFKERRGSSKRQSKHQEGVGQDKHRNGEFKVTALKYWERQTNHRYKANFESFDELSCHSESSRKNEENKNLDLDFEKFKKPIDTPNITQSRPGTNQKLLSPQQPDKILWPRDTKAAWPPSKNLGRPQLHIFIPSIPLKDTNDECYSESENFVNDFYQ